MSRAQCEECTRCIHPSRWPRVRNELSVFSKTRRHRHQPPDQFPTLSSAPSLSLLPYPPYPMFRLRPRGRETAAAWVRSCVADRDASVPLQVVNETDLSLSLSPTRYRSRYCCMRSLSSSRIIISRQLEKELPNGERITRDDKREGVFPIYILKFLFPGERESLSN